MIKTSWGLNFVNLGLKCKIKSSQTILKMGIHKIKSTKNIKKSISPSNFRFFKFSKSIIQILVNLEKCLFSSSYIIKETSFKTLNVITMDISISYDILLFDITAKYVTFFQMFNPQSKISVHGPSTKFSSRI